MDDYNKTYSGAIVTQYQVEAKFKPTEQGRDVSVAEMLGREDDSMRDLVETRIVTSTDILPRSSDDSISKEIAMVAWATAIALWADDERLDRSFVLDQIADALSCDSSTAGTGWTVVDSRNFVGLHPHCGDAHMAKGELILWEVPAEEGAPWWHVTHAGEQIASFRGGSVDDPPTDQADEVYAEYCRHQERGGGGE